MFLLGVVLLITSTFAFLPPRPNHNDMNIVVKSHDNQIPPSFDVTIAKLSQNDPEPEPEPEPEHDTEPETKPKPPRRIVDPLFGIFPIPKSPGTTKSPTIENNKPVFEISQPKT